MPPFKTRAVDLAEGCLADALPRRWSHVMAVGRKAELIARAVPVEDADVLISSAWLHDVGYAPGAVSTGLHQLDGARWLIAQGIPKRIAALVAYHSCAEFEAEERGLADELCRDFSAEHSATADALWYADMTTGPDGQDLSVEGRLSEIRERYGPEHPVTRFWRRAEPVLIAAVRRTEARLSL